MSARQPMVRPWPHRLAVLTAWATLILILVGGVVTSKGAGLAVPDWPTTFGYNMFVYPWSRMVGGILYEHSHRLVGSLVGLLTVALALSLWIQEPRPWVQGLGLAALVAVIAQGVLGGLRVVLRQETLGILHGCLAQAFFGLIVSVAVVTSPEWIGRPATDRMEDAGRLQGLGSLTAGLIYIQTIFGAVLRHTGVGLAPHVLVGALVTGQVIWLAVRVRRRNARQRHLRRPTNLLSGLLVLQLLLGLASSWMKFVTHGAGAPAFALVATTTAHVVTGALMLGTALTFTLRVSRLLSSPQGVMDQRAAAERVPA